MQGADQHIRSSLGFSVKDTLTCRPRESNQQPSDNKTLDLPLRNSQYGGGFNLEDVIGTCDETRAAQHIE